MSDRHDTSERTDDYAAPPPSAPARAMLRDHPLRLGDYRPADPLCPAAASALRLFLLAFSGGRPASGVFLAATAGGGSKARACILRKDGQHGFHLTAFGPSEAGAIAALRAELRRRLVEKRARMAEAEAADDALAAGEVAR